MRRFAALLILVLAIAFSFAGCGGSSKKTAPGIPTSLKVNNSPLSISRGQVVQLSLAATDANGNNITGLTFTYNVPAGAVASVSTGGLVCGGTWDSLSSPIVCTPAGSSGQTTVTVTVNEATSVTASVPVFVHSNVDRVVVAPSGTAAACVSQTGTSTFQAQAFSQGADITADVGPFTWAVTPATVATTDTSGATCTTGATCTITAATPGQATVVATVANTVSAPVTFTTCPVQKILVADLNSALSSSVNTGATISLGVGALDTNGNVVSAILNYSSLQPASSTASGGTVTAIAPGTSAISVSCTPPSCNNGLYPVYGPLYYPTVTGTSTTTVYVASTGGTSMVPIDTSTNTVGTAITLAQTPNSIRINAQGTKIVLGSDSGVMVYDIAAATFTSPGINGKVLAISPDGTTALISNTSIAALYAYSISGNTVTAYHVPGATRAAFSPDSSRAYVVGGTQLTVWAPSSTPPTFNIGAVNDVDFIAQGSFAYVGQAGASQIAVYPACKNTATPVATVTTSGVPALVRRVPWGFQATQTNDSMLMLAVDSPSIDVITVNTNGSTGLDPATLSCVPPTLTNSTPVSHDFGVGPFTATQLIVTPDSSKAFVLAGDQTSLLVYDIAADATSTIALGATPFTGGTTLDSGFLYVGASDNKVHRIDTKAGTDVGQIPISFTPDLVAVRPK